MFISALTWPNTITCIPYLEPVSFTCSTLAVLITSQAIIRQTSYDKPF